MKISLIVASIVLAFSMAGCATPRSNISRMHLGMSPDEVRDAMGEPFAIRAAKEYENGRSSEIWEYVTTRVSLYPKTYWIFFENDKVVQWGEPGDLSGQTQTGNIPISEYNPENQAR